VKHPSSCITYAPRPDATPEAELCALAATYRLILGAKQSGRLPDKSGPDDGPKVKGDSADEPIIPERS
jgi:hypothetical protein